jgi:protoheme IX farnesyltransferase
MMPPTEVIVVGIARARRQLAADLLALTKPRVVVMILVTTLVGYYVGLTGAPDYVRMLHLIVGTLLAAGGTLALNQYSERHVDALMERTRMRPLPDGRVQPLEALLFGAAITILGVVYLAAFVGALSAAVTAATAVLYLFAYTPLKLRTALCTIVGAVPGALLLGVTFAVLGGWQALAPSTVSARRVLYASLLYLPALLALLALDKV